MASFKVDETRCIKCGMCVRDCAFKALKMANGGFPEMAKPESCMKCQHCLAVCPKGAVSLDGLSASESVETKGLELPSAEAAVNWMHVRRSTRQFRKDVDVDPAILDKVLKALANSPTGCNARSLTFTCYPNRVSMDEFRAKFIKTIECHRDGNRLLPRWLAVPAIKMRRGGEDVFFRGASGLLIISSDETSPQVATPLEDVAAAATYFEFLAGAHGIATCWCGFLKMVQGEIPELLERTAGLRPATPFYAMLFGVPAIRYPRGVQRDGYAKIVYR